MERRAITVEGIVQGVGFRPFVYTLALQLGLTGSVKNQAGCVLIEAEGSPADLDRFVEDLQGRAPPLARIDSLTFRTQSLRGEGHFRIEPSESGPDPDEGANRVFVSPDMATCPECLAELFDPTDRHFRYPFLNCTNCGPRLTIIRGAPYDRGRTTMAAFPMCTDCAAEYNDPQNRRFHAQPTACPACGPRLSVCKRNGERIECSDPLALFAEALRRGGIGAMKGLGGFHLACVADAQDVVLELRRRKHRDEKPFAVMVRDVETAARCCEFDASEEELLISQRRPIVLLKKRPASRAGPVCDAVAPGNPRLGVMLPYTPLHHLLLDEFKSDALVMTSGNRSDEPIAYEDADAFERLAEIADLFLVHNRPIHVRCDDSVTRIVDSRESPVRRSRGYSPQPVLLPIACPRPILAVGGQLKGVFGLGRDRQAFLSHHLGDLDHWEAYKAFVRDVGLYEELFGLEPALLVHDLHPDYASTNYALQRATADQLPTLAVQHHHAHLASCMAEHGLTEPVIGVSFDGTGYGTDGTIWGGEFLVADYRRFRRMAHLRPVGLPGGDSAVREPWRIALAHLLDAGCQTDRIASRIDSAKIRTIAAMLDRRFNTPLTSSAGRLFDAVASLAGLRDTVSYEGQAAVELEWLATQMPRDGSYPFEIVASRSGSNRWPAGGQSPLTEIDTRPVIRAILADVQSGSDPRKIARRFHSTVVEIIAATCAAIRSETVLETVVLSGGVFMNALVATETAARLTADGFRVYRHVQVPPNDGGICLGQLAIGAALLADRPVDPLIERAGLVSTPRTSLARVSELHGAGASTPISSSRTNHARVRSASEQSARRYADHSQASGES